MWQVNNKIKGHSARYFSIIAIAEQAGVALQMLEQAKAISEKLAKLVEERRKIEREQAEERERLAAKKTKGKKK